MDEWKIELKDQGVYYLSNSNLLHRKIVGSVYVSPDTSCAEFKTADKRYHWIPLHNINEIITTVD